MSMLAIASRSDCSFRKCVWADAVAQYPPEFAVQKSKYELLLRALICSSGFRCVTLFRLSSCMRRLPWVGACISRCFFWFGRHWYGCAISATAQIGGGLVLPHPQGIVIGGEAKVGCRCWIFQNVTIGGAPDKAGQPLIGDDCRIYTGAVISGPITMGDRVVVGANAVVSKDVPEKTIVRCASMRFDPHRTNDNSSE